MLYIGDVSVTKDDIGYEQRTCHVFDDRAHYMTKDRNVAWEADKKTYSMNLDGGDIFSMRPADYGEMLLNAAGEKKPMAPGSFSGNTISRTPSTTLNSVSFL